MTAQWLIKNKVTAGFALALVVLVMIGIEAYLNLLKYKQAVDRVNHTLKVQNSLESIFSKMKDAETSHRGYILTGDELFLEPYYKTRQSINPDLQELGQLTLDNAHQQHRLKTLNSLAAAKLAFIQENVALRQTQGLNAALKMVQTGRGEHLMKEIREQVEQMKLEENDLLEQRSASLQRSAQETLLIVILGSLLAVGLVALAMITINRDLGKRKQVEEQLRLLNQDLERRVNDRTQELETSNRLKDEFLSVLSHELRTPLNAMMGWSKMLRSGKLDRAKTEQGLEIIERNAKSQAQLIDDLLDISRIITGKLRLNVRPISLVPVIKAALDTVRPAADARSIRIQTVLDSDASPISGDPDRLQQVVWNLLSNAIKFTPKGGRVQVRLERINSHVEIIISDTGQGISPEFLPHVFNRFTQADSSITRSHSGLGLGLAIVRNIVELHGGSIHADSPGEGEGSTFVVNLPLTIIHRSLDTPDRVYSTARTDVPLDNAPSLSGLQILVVDDEVDAREMLSVLLEQCGASVTTVASASEAFEMLQRLKPDILVSDIGMPDEDGYTLITRIRDLSAEKGGQTPAIALTAYARTEDRIRALAAGFQTHMAKPVEPAELIAVIQSLTR